MFAKKQQTNTKEGETDGASENREGEEVSNLSSNLTAPSLCTNNKTLQQVS